MNEVRDRYQGVAAATLCAAAGMADAIGYVNSDVFAANMTGNTVLVGLSLAEGQWQLALERASTVLAFMGGAIIVGLGAFALARRRARSLLGEPMRLPGKRAIDGRLILGAALFGVGWGLSGICPGPALVLVGSGMAKGLLFTMAMIVGMGLYERFAAPPSDPR